MALIEIDYVDTIRKAEELEQLARELKSISANGLEEIKSGIDAGWKGSASVLYKKKINELSHQLASQAEDLLKIAERLGKTAKRYQKLEQMAKNIFGD